MASPFEFDVCHAPVMPATANTPNETDTEADTGLLYPTMDPETKRKSESFALCPSAISVLSVATSGIIDLSDAELTALGFLGESELLSFCNGHLPVIAVRPCSCSPDYHQGH